MATTQSISAARQPQQSTLDLIASATGRDGKALATWVPDAVRDALAHPGNNTFRVVPEASYSMDRRLCLEVSSTFPEFASYTGKRRIECGDRLVFSVWHDISMPMRVGGSVYLAQLTDGSLTLVFTQEELTEEPIHPRRSLPSGEPYLSVWRLMYIDAFSGLEVAHEAIRLLGDCVYHGRPDMSPAPYGGATSPVDAIARTSDGDLEAVLLRDASMEPVCKRGEYVVYRPDAEACSGDIVMALVSFKRKLPKPPLWKRSERQDWETFPYEFDPQREGFTVRRLHYDEQGRCVLQPINGDCGAETWQEGATDAHGWATDIGVLGVYVEATVWGQSGSSVAVFLKARTQEALEAA